MTNIFTSIAAAAALSVLPAIAAAFPVGTSVPAYSADYTLTAEGETQSMTMHSSGDKLRVNLDAGPASGASIIDMTTMESFMLVDTGGMKMAMKVDAKQALTGMPAEVSSPDTLPAPNGSKTIAGETCNTYRVEGADICMTSDGILLEALSPDGNMVATRVTRGAQPASLFEVPAGYQVMDMGSMMGGLSGMTLPDFGQ